HIFVEPVEYSQLTSSEKAESSAEIKKRVNRARKIQVDRYKELGIYSNASLDSQDLNTYCPLDDTATKMLESAFTKLGLSARAYTRIVKVARTIADLAGEENISFEHVAEAIQFRSLDRQIFG
ncbi:MAG: magnesium chelatase, partial [Clostridia bacterium]|nr:magnesium chelatase [Clostridia bacterium]